MEIRDPNSSVVKRITFDNSSNEISPTLRLVATDGAREIRQDVKPHEIRHLFIPRIYQDNKNRAGFINNRRKDLLSLNKSVIITISSTESSIVYVPPDKLEGTEKYIDLDPDEEFQVDESNHGLYLLNYSDTENVTRSPLSAINSLTNDKGNENISPLIDPVRLTTSLNAQDTTLLPQELLQDKKPETNIIANSTDIQSHSNIRNGSDKDNQTLFISDKIYNHFRPLESELPDEEMAPFIYFGQKLGGPIISDNLTNSPSLSASTKSVNFIAAPPDKRKFNSRYSATEKYKNTNAGEDEINEDMDVSVVKNVIEKNKIRNTVKGPAPARPVGLVSAYRKYSSTTQTTPKSPTLPDFNVTESIILNVTPSSVENGTNITVEAAKNNLNTTREFNVNRTTTVPTPRNYTRSYFNLRRRPPKSTASSSEAPTTPINATTEKLSTSVYTAVVTSVSITSSMKGQNKTDDFKELSNDTIADTGIDNNNFTIQNPNITAHNVTSTVPPTTNRPIKHRIRIRTTTTESTLSENPLHSSNSVTQKPSSLIGENITRVDLVSEITTPRFSESISILPRQSDYDNSSYGSTMRPKNVLRRRRPTTTTTTTITTKESPSSTLKEYQTLTTTLAPTRTLSAIRTPLPEVGKTITPLILASTTSTSTKAIPVISNNNVTNPSENNTTVNVTIHNEIENDSRNEEVVIEAEKTYTASYILAGLGFLPVAAVIAFFLRNFLNKKTKEVDTEYEGYFDDGEIKKESPITPVARPPLPPPSKPDQKWEFPRNKLRLQTLLGEGNFGQVNYVILIYKIYVSLFLSSLIYEAILPETYF